jgi:hypothetical protein
MLICDWHCMMLFDGKGIGYIVWSLNNELMHEYVSLVTHIAIWLLNWIERQNEAAAAADLVSSAVFESIRWMDEYLCHHGKP